MEYTLPNFEGKSVSKILDIIRNIPEEMNGKVIDEINFFNTNLFATEERGLNTNLLGVDLSRRGNVHLPRRQFRLPVNDIISIINAIPEHIKHLNLCHTGLDIGQTSHDNNGHLGFEQLQCLYSAIGNPRFNELTLSVNPLGDTPNLAQLFGKLKQERIHLERTCLGRASDLSLKLAGEALQDTVTHLNISGNQLGKSKNITELHAIEGSHNVSDSLKAFISSLATKHNLKEIDVSDNDIEKNYTPSEIVSIFSQLPKGCSVKGIDLISIRNQVIEERLVPFHDVIHITDNWSLDEIQKIKVQMEAIAPELDDENPIPDSDEDLYFYTLNKARVAFEKSFPEVFDENEPWPETYYPVENYRLLCALCYSIARADKDALILLMQPFSNPDLQRLADKEASELLLNTNKFDHASLQEKTARYQLMAHGAQNDKDSVIYRFAMAGLKNPDSVVTIGDINVVGLEQDGPEPFKLNESIEKIKDTVLNVINPTFDGSEKDKIMKALEASIKGMTQFRLVDKGNKRKELIVIKNKIENAFIADELKDVPALLKKFAEKANEYRYFKKEDGTHSFKQFKKEFQKLANELEGKEQLIDELLSSSSKKYHS